MFLFKKILSPFFLPLTLSVVLLLLGLVLVWFQKKGRSGKILLTIGVLLLVPLSYSAVANRLTAPLECRYPPVQLSEVRGIRWIVILGNGAQADSRYPPTSQLNRESLSSLSEGIRLYRKLPGCKLLLSGGAVFDTVPEAEIMSEAAQELGVHHQDILLETTSRDTEDQARTIHDIVGKERFLLVTGSFHMPRAVALFKKNGANPVAAPAGICPQKEKRKMAPENFFPSAGALLKSERAFHEYLGILWAKLRGKI